MNFTSRLDFGTAVPFFGPDMTQKHKKIEVSPHQDHVSTSWFPKSLHSSLQTGSFKDFEKY